MVPGSLVQRLRLSSFPVTQIRADSSSPLDVILPVQYFHVIVLQSQVCETKPAAGREGKPRLNLNPDRVFNLYWAILLKEALSSGQAAEHYRSRTRDSDLFTTSENDPRVCALH